MCVYVTYYSSCSIIISLSFLQTTIFNAIIMSTIIINSFTLAMETTALRTSIPLFFIYTDAIFVGIFVLEFSFKVYIYYIQSKVNKLYIYMQLHNNSYSLPPVFLLSYTFL